MATFIIRDIFEIGIFKKQVIIAGDVLNGTITIGMRLNIEGVIMEVNGIESNHKAVSEAAQGTTAGLKLTFIGDTNGTLQKIHLPPPNRHGPFSKEGRFLRTYISKEIEFN